MAPIGQEDLLALRIPAHPAARQAPPRPGTALRPYPPDLHWSDQAHCKLVRTCTLSAQYRLGQAWPWNLARVRNTERNSGSLAPKGLATEYFFVNGNTW